MSLNGPDPDVLPERDFSVHKLAMPELPVSGGLPAGSG